MLQNRTRRIKKYPAKKKYGKELQKNEETSEIQMAFLQNLASEKNKSKGLSSKIKMTMSKDGDD
jgi:hypothetical protein